LSASLPRFFTAANSLLGNRRLQGEARSIYAALCGVTLARIQEPLILIDWSDLKADQSLHLLRASLPVGGRSLTLYEEVHPQRRLNNRRVQQRFLQRLAELLPPHVAPVIVADAGFKVPFYREVERLGWRWVGRVRGARLRAPDHALGQLQGPVQARHAHRDAAGGGRVGAQQPAAGAVCPGAPAAQGTAGKTTRGRRARSKKSEQSARAAREPWLLVASVRCADLAPKQLVRRYRQRMQIEISHQ
jgi:hypothetical protein